MIVRLAPEQIAGMWDLVRPGIIETMAPIADQNHETIQRVLRSLLSEDMQLWLGFESPENLTADGVYGFMVTTIYKDVVSETKSLLIYSLVEIKDMPPLIWSLGMRKLRDFAQLNGCTNIIAYSNIPRIIDTAKTLGFKPMVFLRKEL